MTELSEAPAIGDIELYCPGCGARDSGNFCSCCGGHLPRICRCGAPVRADEAYCCGCGTPTRATAQAAERRQAPAVGDIGLVRGDVHVRHGVSAESLTDLVHNLAPDGAERAERWRMRAARALDAEQFEDALCALERALALHPNSEKALALLARTHQRRRKLWDAVRTWGRLYRLAPDRFDPHAGADETVKALPDSAPVLIEALSELPVGSLTVRLMEQLKVEPEYVDQALPVLADFCVQLPASEQCPRAPLLDCEERGWFLARRIVAGALLDVDPARCVAFCEEALSAQADDPLATMLFAGALAQLGRSGEAIERMQAFTERFPGDQAAADLLERLRKFGPSASIA